jgi:hypothetical protein
MTAGKKRAPQVAAGTVIGMSALAMYAMMAVMVVVTAAAVGMIIAWLTTRDASIWLLLGDLLLLLFGPLAIVAGFFRVIVIDPGYTESLATIYAMLAERAKPFMEGVES